MLTYTGSRNLFGTLALDKSAAVLASFDILQNNIIRKICSAGDYPWKNKTKTIATVADKQSYQLPNDLYKLDEMRHIVGDQNYVPIQEVTTKKQWDIINTGSASGDTPEYFYVRDGAVELYPIPATSDNTLSIDYVKKHVDLSVADYITGTVTSITNGETTVVGSGTTWIDEMIGRFIQLPDAQWYEIDSITSTTELELVKTYMGISVAAATENYIIGQCSMLPEESQMLPVLEGLELFFTSIQPDATKASLYKTLKTESYSLLKKEESTGVTLSKGKMKITNPQKHYNV